MIVRPATLDDSEAILKLARAMHQESSSSHMDWQDEKIINFIKYSFQDEPFFYVGVIEDEDGIFGFVGGSCYPTFFGNDKQCCDTAVYVTPKRRGFKAAVKLIKSLEEWGISQGAVQCNVGTSAGIVDESYMKLLNKLGYRKAGFIGRKQLSSVTPILKG